MTRYKTTNVDGLSVFYREAGDPANPKLLLLGGFPASSHQFRNLIPALEDRFHVVSPDYPGFGNTDMPDPAAFDYTFDRLSEIVERLLVQIGFDRFGLYMQDYGGPIGNCIVGRHPEWLEWLIVRNSNAYEEGFTEVWDAIRHALWQNRSSETEALSEPFLERDGVMQIYMHGHKDPEKISPDNRNMDLYFLARPNAHRVQLDLLYDYRKNVEVYPEWQAFLREQRPLRSSCGARTTSSSPRKVAGPTFATFPTQSGTCSTAVTLPWRIASTRSPSISGDSTSRRWRPSPLEVR